MVDLAPNYERIPIKMEPHSGGEITKSIYLGAQVELGGNLAISYHETHATGRLREVLEL